MREMIWVFIQHSSDDRLQPTKLKHTDKVKLDSAAYYSQQYQYIHNSVCRDHYIGFKITTNLLVRPHFHIQKNVFLKK